MGQVEVASRLGLSELAPRLVQSEIRAMSVACDAMGGVNLAQGVCDTEVPEVVAEGAIRALLENPPVPAKPGPFPAGATPFYPAASDKAMNVRGMFVQGMSFPRFSGHP